MSRRRWQGTDYSPDDELGLGLGCALSVVLVLALVAVELISHWWQ